jgi:diguanylate cyclase (GGDEF)-like protein
MYYSAIGVIAVLVLLIENEEIFLNRAGLALKAQRRYRRFLLAVLAYYATDILWGIIESLKIPSLLFVDTSLYFVSMALAVMLWTQFAVAYLEADRAEGRVLDLVGRGYFVVVAATVAVNVFAPVLFSVDAQCVYKALAARYVLLAAVIVLLLCVSIYALSPAVQRSRPAELRQRYRAIAFFGLVASAFLVLQLWFPYLPLYSMALMLGTSVLRFRVIAGEKDDERRRILAERLKGEHRAYARVNALVGEFICIYDVDPETDYYQEYRSVAQYEAFAVPKEGGRFFEASRENIRGVLVKEDQERFLSLFSKESVLREIERCGIFTLSYRIHFGERAKYVQLKAVLVAEEGEKRLIVGLQDIDAAVRHEEDYARRIAQIRDEAHTDVLTGLKNRNAYAEAKTRLDRQIKERTVGNFAVVVMDLNDLKTVNDTQGHRAGDQYLREAGRHICNVFSHSPVFRMGGDEFVVICQGRDYENIDELVRKAESYTESEFAPGRSICACGMARFEADSCVNDVFERADHSMYVSKRRLKSLYAAAAGA